MSVTPIKPPPEQGTHFWFITIQNPSPPGFWVSTQSGTVTPMPGETRLDLFSRLRAHVDTLDPRNQGGNVLAFDVQPNQI